MTHNQKNTTGLIYAASNSFSIVVAHNKYVWLCVVLPPQQHCPVIVRIVSIKVNGVMLTTFNILLATPTLKACIHIHATPAAVIRHISFACQSIHCLFCLCIPAVVLAPLLAILARLNALRRPLKH